MPSTIDLRLFATLRRFSPDSADNYIIEPDISLSDLLNKLGIPKDEAKLTFINGKKAEWATLLQDGDRVGIFPPVGGG